MKGAATWAGFALAAVSAVWGGESLASPGKGPPKVGGEVEISSLPFDLNEVIRTVRKNRGLPEEPTKQGFRAETRGERPFASKGRVFSHETPRFQAEIDEDGLRYFAQGNKEKPDFEILSVSFERGGVSKMVFGKGRIEERVPGLLQGETRDGVTPYVRNRGEEGVELYWVVEENVGRGLHAAPSGGDTVPALQVIFTVQAAGEPQEHAEGLIFPTSDGSGQVTLSNVTVVDSAGRREALRPAVSRQPLGISKRKNPLTDPWSLTPNDYEIVFTISEKFLENARYPILIDPTVGPEFPVEPSPVYSPAANFQYNPSVASNGTDYFVAWQDNRQGGYDIYGTRVTSAGVVLDPAGIAVSTDESPQEYPSVASNGTDYFVAWEDWRNSGTTNWDIYGTRVTSAGVVLDPAGIAVSTAVDDQERPSVASNGADYFVVWGDWRNGADADIYGARVRASDGALLDGPPDTGGVAVSTAADAQRYPSAASNGTDYFVAWTDFRIEWDIYGARVRASDGLLLDDPPDTGGIAVCTEAGSQGYPSVASNGANYFVAWGDYRSVSLDIYGARVSFAGSVLDPSGFAVSTEANGQDHPAVASNGTDYFVAWGDGRSGSVLSDIYGARVTSAGAVLDPTGIAITTDASDQESPAVSSNGLDYFTAWEDDRNGTYDIYGARVASSDGTVLDPAGIVVSTKADYQGIPSVASNGTDYFVAWQDYRSGTDIYGARVAPDGTVLDPAGIAVSTAANSQPDPSAASNGTDYFVVWEDMRNSATTDWDIYGTRVRASDGALLDGTPDTGGIAVSTAVLEQMDPSVASNGTDYFVAWEDWRSGDADIYGARVASSDGTVLDPAGIAVSTANLQLDPSAASNGTDYFVVWDDFDFVDDDIYGARVASSDGKVLDPSGIAVSTAAGSQVVPSVASNGSGYFVAWMDWRGTDWDIYGARVTSAGTVLDPLGIAVSTAASTQWPPSVASNGTDYFVAWQDERSGADYDIYGARVASAGTVLDPSGLLIQQSAYDDRYPSVAHSACGKYLVTYQRYYEDPNFQSTRVMARLFYDGLVPSCIVEEVSAAGSTNSLLVEDAGGGQVKIWWENHGDIMQYNIYEGDLDSLPPYNHLSLVCWTAGTDEGGGYLSGIITPSYTNAYYLVTECDTATEGTSGYDSDAVERNPALNTCGPHP